MSDEKKFQDVKKFVEVMAKDFACIGVIKIKCEDALFLVEQADRKQELEYRNGVIENRNYELEKSIKDYQKVNKNMYDKCGDFKFENLKLEQQNNRYREAFRQIKLQILFEGTIELHRENIIEIIDEVLESELE